MLSKIDKKRLVDAGMATLIAGLQGAKAVLDTTSIPGASAVFSIILTCIDEAQKASRNADILKSVRAQVDAILATLGPLDAAPESQQDHDIARALKEAALNLATELSNRADVVKRRTTHTIRPAWMTRGSDEEALQDFVTAVDDDLKRFQIAQGNRIERYLEAIKQQTIAIRADVEVIRDNTREIKRGGTANERETKAILDSAQAIQDRTNTIDTTTVATKVIAQEEAAEAQEREWDRLLADLRQAPLASFDAERPGTIDSCSGQTRAELLEEVDKWIADPESDHIYWLKERAGFGKTAIAISVAERAAARRELAASFFFSHQLSDLNNASLFFPTIAFQLALHDKRRYRQVFAEAVRDAPNAGATKLKHQVEALFVKPLRRVEATSTPLVIVIDALDECKPEHAQELVDVLTNALKTIPLPLRIFITSRPEHHLTTSFEAFGISSRTFTDKSYSDVETYLRNELPNIPRKLGIDNWSRDWITESEIVVLVTHAGGLFVYANTVVRFIGYRTALNPRKRLDILLREDETQSAAYQPYQPLDRLYKRVLDVATDRQPDLVEEVLTVLGARTVIEERLPLSLLASLLALGVDDVRRSAVRLQSVIICPETDDGLVSFHHASFKDFLVDPKRSGPTYSIETSAHHHRHALRSMQIISQSPLRSYIENLVEQEDYVLYTWTPDQELPAELTYAVEGVFRHTVRAQYDIALKNAFDEWLQQGYPWFFEIFEFDGKDVRETCTWRISKGDPPETLLVLEAFASLQPSDGRRNGQILTRCSFARKEIRRYCRVASEYRSDDRVASFHQQLRTCVHDAESRGRSILDNRDRMADKNVRKFATELGSIVDKFQLSVGDDGEIQASRQRKEKMISRFREASLTYLGNF